MRRIIYPLVASLISLSGCDLSQKEESTRSRTVNGAKTTCGYKLGSEGLKYLVSTRIDTPTGETVYFDSGEFVNPVIEGRRYVFSTPLNGRMDPKTRKFEEFSKPEDVDPKYLEGALSFCMEGDTGTREF